MNWIEVDGDLACKQVEFIGGRYYAFEGTYPSSCPLAVSSDGRNWTPALTEDGRSLEVGRLLEFEGKVYALEENRFSDPQSWWLVAGESLIQIDSQYGDLKFTQSSRSSLTRGVERGNGVDILALESDRTRILVRSHETSQWSSRPLLDPDGSVLGSTGVSFDDIEPTSNGYLARDTHNLYFSTDLSHWENLTRLGREVDQIEEFDPEEVDWGIIDTRVYISRDGLVWERLPHPDGLSLGGLPYQVMNGWILGIFSEGGGPSAIYRRQLGSDWERWGEVGRGEC